MKLGIISDTHDRLDRIEKAGSIFNENKVGLVLHAGDFISPFALKRFAKLQTKLIGVYGNNDGDRIMLKEVATELGFELHNSPWEFDIDGKKVVIMHEPLFIQFLSGYDLVIYGHTHNLDIREGKPIVVNPGDASGWLGRATLVILDTASMEPTIFNL